MKANLKTENLRKFVTRCLWILFVFGLTTTLLADELRGKVVSIADGDTITVLDADKKQHKVRLTGIDAPEKRQAFGADQNWGIVFRVLRVVGILILPS